MLVLGSILILLAAGALVAVLASGTDDQAALYGGSLDVPTLVVFLAGAAALLLFIMGLELVRSGLKRANQNHKKTKRLKKLEKQEETRQETRQEVRDERAASSATAASEDESAGRGPGGDGPYETPPPPR